MLAEYISYGKIDHIAIAVTDLNSAIERYTNLFGFKLQRTRNIQGKYSGMNSAELNAGDFSIVLVQATESESQIARYIDEYGTGVQHVAISVPNLEDIAKKLSNRGVVFATKIIEGEGLIQIFTKRDPNTGMMFEFIERRNTAGFEARNIQQLFHQLEESDAY